MDAKPVSAIDSAKLEQLEFARRLAEMSYLGALGKMRAFANEHLPGQVFNITFWRNHTTMAFTCECLVPPASGKGKAEKMLTVVFQGTGFNSAAWAGSVSDLWYDMLGSHTTDLIGSNGKYIGRVALGFYISYNMLRRQDTYSTKLSAHSEGPRADLDSIGITPSFAWGGTGLVEYVKNQVAASSSSGKVFVVGHSLGGSMAQIFAADVALSGYVKAENIELITFGSPRALGHKLAKSSEIAKIKHSRLVNSFDPVPRHPLYGEPHPLGGPRHVGYRNYSLGGHRLYQKHISYLDLSGLGFSNKDVCGESKVLGITRHFGTPIYALPRSHGSVQWVEMDYDDFHGSEAVRLQNQGKEIVQKLTSRCGVYSLIACCFCNLAKTCCKLQLAMCRKSLALVPGGVPDANERASHSLGVTRDDALSLNTYNTLLDNSTFLTRLEAMRMER